MLPNKAKYMRLPFSKSDLLELNVGTEIRFYRFRFLKVYNVFLVKIPAFENTNLRFGLILVPFF